jgi:hypothetical protein
MRMPNDRGIFRVVSPLVVLAAVGSACSDKPDAPVFDNPFDPQGSGPDPFELTATLAGDSIRLEWIDREDFPIASYAVWWDTLGPPSVGAPLSEITISTSGGLATAFHRDFLANRPNWYRVEARDAAGEGSSLSLPAAAVIVPPPRVRLAGGVRSTPTRFVQLELLSDAGDEVELAHAPDFSDGLREAIEPGKVRTVDWELPPVASNSEDVEIFVRGLAAGAPGQSGSVIIDVSFAPRPSTASGSTSIADTVVTLIVNDLGVERMRFALSAEALTAAPWKPGAPSTVIRWPLEIEESRRVHAEFESDFGFAIVDSSLSLTPDLSVESASMEIDGGEEFTFSRTVQIVSSAPGAGYVRFSEDPSFAGTSFVSYADTMVYELISPGAGEKTVYGQFTNPWDPVGRADAAQIILLGSAKR